MSAPAQTPEAGACESAGPSRGEISSPPEALEEITVTANKREQLLLEVPDSISAFTAETIENARIGNVKDVASRVPNFSIIEAQQPGVALLNVRGVGQARNGEPPVAVVVDGVQLSNAYQITQDLFDIERIELAKGPQGAVYGRNAIGGAINIVTRRPTNEHEARLALGYGTGEDWRVSAAASGPIVADRLLFRVAGSLRDFDGDIASLNTPGRDRANAQRDRNVRGRLLFMPTEAVGIDLRYSRLETEAGAAWYAPVPSGGSIDEPRPYIGEYPSYAERILDDASVKVDVDLGAATLTSITAWSRVRSLIDQELDLIPLQGILATQELHTDNVSEELRLTSNGTGPMRWMAGLYYLDTRQKLDTQVFLGRDFFPIFGLPPDLPAPLPLTATRSSDDNAAYAGFGHVSYRFASGLELTGGLRYDVDERRQIDRESAGNPRFRETFRSLQPKLSATWFFSDDAMVYATVAKGFRSGGFNPQDRITRVYGKEENWSYEIGAKRRAWAGRANLAAAAFYTDISDRQVYTLDVTNSAQTLSNPIPKSAVYGLEAEIVARPVPDLDLAASVGYTDSEIRRYDPTVFAGLPVAGDFRGNELPQIAELSYAVSAQYTLRMNGSTTLTPRLEVNGSGGDYYWEIDNRDRRGSLTLVNARLTLTRGALSVMGFVENAFDEEHVLEFIPVEWSGASAGDLSAAAPGRRWGVQVRFAF